MNTGKKFEELFKKSAIEQGFDVTRLKDAGFVGDKSESRRFTPRNICDFVLFRDGRLFYCELKRREKSLRFDELTQQKDLVKKDLSEVNGVDAGYVISMAGDVWWINAGLIEQLEQDTGKKSFNTRDLINLSLEHPCFCFGVGLFIPKGKRAQRINLENLLK